MEQESSPIRINNKHYYEVYKKRHVRTSKEDLDSDYKHILLH